MAQEPDKSSVFTAYLNISKVLIGSGVLALPYAVDQAGLFMSPFLLAFVGVWNAWNVHLLLEAREIAEAICEEKDEFLDEKAIEAGSTYAAVAVIALGPWGGLAIEIGLFVTLIGASASYLITSGELLSETPLGALFSSSMALPMCVLFSALVVLPLVMVRNMGMLAKVSALGLVACIGGFIAIFYTGWDKYGAPWAHDKVSTWPNGAKGVGTFFGIASFCFETCVMTYPIQESMIEPKRFETAARGALMTAWSFYTLIGVGASLLYSCSALGVQGNIMQNLPGNGAIDQVIRIFVSLTSLLTYPLLIIPLTQMLSRRLCQSCVEEDHPSTVEEEAELIKASPRSYTRRLYTTIPLTTFSEKALSGDESSQDHLALGSPVPPAPSPLKELDLGSPIIKTDQDDLALDTLADSDSEEPEEPGQRGPSCLDRAMLRIPLLLITTGISCVMPCFGPAVSLVGAFSVTFVSFVMPPIIVMKLRRSRTKDYEDVDGSGWGVSLADARDGCSFIFGLLLMVLASSLDIDAIANGSCSASSTA